MQTASSGKSSYLTCTFLILLSFIYNYWRITLSLSSDNYRYHHVELGYLKDVDKNLQSSNVSKNTVQVAAPR